VTREEWAACQDGVAMFKALAKQAGPPGSASRRPLVLAACECARLALPYVRKDETRPLAAIEMAERWASGEEGVTLEQVKAAAGAAAYASHAAFVAADLSYAAFVAADLSYATFVAATAAALSAHAADTAHAADDAAYAIVSAAYAADAAGADSSSVRVSAAFAAYQARVLRKCADIVRKCADIVRKYFPEPPSLPSPPPYGSPPPSPTRSLPTPTPPSPLKRVWIPQLIASGMLLWALNPKNPYGYYILLRCVCCGVFVYLSLCAAEQDKRAWTWLLGITAVVYNPILRVHLTRDIWSVVNVATISCTGFDIRPQEEQGQGRGCGLKYVAFTASKGGVGKPFSPTHVLPCP